MLADPRKSETEAVRTRLRHRRSRPVLARPRREPSGSSRRLRQGFHILGAQKPIKTKCPFSILVSNSMKIDPHALCIIISSNVLIVRGIFSFHVTRQVIFGFSMPTQSTASFAFLGLAASRHSATGIFFTRNVKIFA